MNLSETFNDWSTRTKQFYQDVRGEMKKVSWPSRQEIVSTTVVVLAATFFFGIYLGVVDAAVYFGVERIFRFFGVGG
jgi:preprotein translocase subunit SecE